MNFDFSRMARFLSHFVLSKSWKCYKIYCKSKSLAADEIQFYLLERPFRETECRIISFFFSLSLECIIYLYKFGRWSYHLRCWQNDMVTLISLVHKGPTINDSTCHNRRITTNCYIQSVGRLKENSYYNKGEFFVFFIILADILMKMCPTSFLWRIVFHFTIFKSPLLY